MIKRTDRDKVAAARMDLCINNPYYGSVFLRLNVFEDSTCPTAWTDGRSIGYNLDYTASLTHNQIKGLFVHECKHVILKHHIRMVTNPDFRANPDKWNVAGDYALNPVIKESPGMDICPTWLYNPKWKDALADDIFYQLKPEDMPEGTNSDGSIMPGEVRPMAPSNKNQSNPSPADIDHEIQKVDQWIKAAAFKVQGAGKMTNDLAREIRADKQQSVNWEDELQFLAHEICRNDYTWARPNVRYLQSGVYLPTLCGKKVSDMVFFVDCSGSVNNSQLSTIATEIQAIVDTYSIRVIVVYWNTKFSNIEIFDSSDVVSPNFKLSIQGSGGTNFRTCWDWLEENVEEYDVDPKALIFFSDLACSNYPDNDPGVPVLWCQVPNGNRFCDIYLSYLPEYGKHVRCKIYS